jgi:hypothetical protein
MFEPCVCSVCVISGKSKPLKREKKLHRDWPCWHLPTVIPAIEAPYSLHVLALQGHLDVQLPRAFYGSSTAARKPQPNCLPPSRGFLS